MEGGVCQVEGVVPWCLPRATFPSARGRHQPEGGLSEMFFHSDNTTLVKQRSCPRAKRRPALRCISQDSPEKQSQQEVCVERDLIKELTQVAAEASPEPKSEWMGHTRFLEGKLLYLASPPVECLPCPETPAQKYADSVWSDTWAPRPHDTAT